MTNAAALAATYASFRHVPSRKVLQVVFEIPIEQTEHAMKVLGVPKPEEARWFAIAAMEAEKPKEEKRPRRWEELSNAEQAGIRCNDARFLLWAGYTRDEAIEWVRRTCKVQTRKDLDRIPQAKAAWRTLDQSFRDHCATAGLEHWLR